MVLRPWPSLYSGPLPGREMAAFGRGHCCLSSYDHLAALEAVTPPTPGPGDHRSDISLISCKLLPQRLGDRCLKKPKN